MKFKILIILLGKASREIANSVTKKRDLYHSNLII